MTTAEAQRRTTWIVRLDNDYFAFWRPVKERPDHDYTQGFSLTALRPFKSRISKLLPDCDACRSWGTAAISQEIYTPEVDARTPQPGQRPYAGWLAAGFGVARLGPGYTAGARIVLGVTGPPSLAEAVQVGAHRLLGYREPLGWASQLPTELGVYAEYELSKRIMSGSAGPVTFQLIGGGAARVGTVYVDGRASARFTAGLHPATESRTVPGSMVGGNSLFVWVAGHLDGVARNEFLQGTAFRSSTGIPIQHGVQEIELGLSARLGEVLLAGTYVRRGREYLAQTTPHAYVRFTVALMGSAEVGVNKGLQRGAGRASAPEAAATPPCWLGDDAAARLRDGCR